MAVSVGVAVVSNAATVAGTGVWTAVATGSGVADAPIVGVAVAGGRTVRAAPSTGVGVSVGKVVSGPAVAVSVCTAVGTDAGAPSSPQAARNTKTRTTIGLSSRWDSMDIYYRTRAGVDLQRDMGESSYSDPCGTASRAGYLM